MLALVLRSRRFSLLTFLVLALIPALRPAPAYAQANVTGQWKTLPYQMPINPIHVALMHTGKIIVVAGSENQQSKTIYRAAVYNPVTGTIVTQQVPWDLFCNGMSFLADGRLLVVGGNLHYYPFYGLPTTTIFDPTTEKFIQVQDMAHGRWYPSNLVLDTGDTLTFGGYNETGSTNRAIEIYEVPTGWSPEFIAPFTPPLYPWLHLLPSGKVFMSGAGGSSNMLTPSTMTWQTNMAKTIYNKTRTYGSSILMPLLPETGYKPRVMIMGGNNPATATAEMIDLSVTTPTWRALPPMSGPRIDMNAVILPNGQIFAQGGSGEHNVASTATLRADLFDPTSETWSSAGTAAFARMYHSVALLLPDATVWTAGSNPTEGTYEKNMEIYSPPYLFTKNSSGQVVAAARPTISAAPAIVGYGASFQVTTPDAADISKVVFIRPGSDTHGFDMEQRYVGLSFTAGAGTLTVTAPPNNRTAPPGYYMIFLLNSKGVPSVAKFVQLSMTPTNQPPQGIITTPSADVAIDPGQSVTFAGSGTDADGSIASYTWIFPGGSPATSSSAVPGAVRFANPGTYTVSLTVVDNNGANDPSPPSVTVTVRGTPVTAAFSTPTAGATVSGVTTIGMTSSASPATYALSIDGTLVSTQTVSGGAASYSWDTTTYTNGSHSLSLKVTDNFGASTTKSQTVTVSNGTAAFTATITYPKAGATVGGTQSVGMSTTAPWSAAKTWKLSVDGSIVFTSAVPTGTTAWFSWDTTATSNGSHTLELTVTDGSGNSASGALSVNVSNSGTTMRASFSAPTAGATVSGTTNVAMAVAGASGTTNTFSLSVDGVEVSTQTVSGTTATYALDTTTLGNGTHTLSVTVTDATVRSATASESITVSNTGAPPAQLTASFTSPASGATVSGTNVSVGMADAGAQGSSTFTLSVDGTQVSTQTVTGSTASFAWNTTTVADGSHTLSFTVRDDGGRTATATRTVTVSNAAPPASFTASFSYPKTGATVVGNQSVGMATTATWGKTKTFTLSVDGTVITTQTLTGTTLWYTWNSTTVSSGSHTLTLAVTFNGATATATLPITVSNGGATAPADGGGTTPAADFTASITYPAGGATVGGTQSIGMSTSLPWGKSKTFTLRADGALIFSAVVPTGTTQWYEWDTTRTSDGTHTLGLTVTDSGGQSATDRISVTVDN